jgi:type IV pilus assembly protein PilW
MQAQSLHKRQLGMSIVELMVAIVISLLGVLVIFQVFAVNEGVRRSTTAGSDEQTSGLLALMLLERDLRHAGFGINDFGLRAATCAPTTPRARPPPCWTSLAPVEIVSNAGTVPDVIRVIYGGSKHTGGGSVLDMKTLTEPVQLIIASASTRRRGRGRPAQPTAR